MSQANPYLGLSASLDRSAAVSSLSISPEGMAGHKSALLLSLLVRSYQIEMEHYCLFMYAELCEISINSRDTASNFLLSAQIIM